MMNRTFAFASLPFVLLTAAGCEQLSIGDVELEQRSLTTDLETAHRDGSTGPSVPEAFDSRLEVAHVAGCTGTLIHPRFILAAAHCRGFPVADPTANIRFFFNKETDPLPPLQVDRSWMHPAWLTPSAPNFTQYDTKAVLNSDLWLGRLASSADSRLTPATIATRYPSDGATVSIYGFGGWGRDCSISVAAPNDYSKRARNFIWGAPPYPVCGGDSGGPTFDAAMPKGDLITVTGSSEGAAGVVHFRERIYEQMRMMINWPLAPSRWLVGTARQGKTLTNGTSTVTSPEACETACIKNAACQAWTLTGQACSLKKYVGPWVPDAASTSGIRPITEPKLSRTLGTALKSQPTGVISALHCAALCGRSSECKAYTFTETSTTKTCKLMSSVATGTAETTATSGVRQSYSEYLNYPAGLMRTESGATTAEACANACAKDDQCQGYSFRVSDSKCFPKYVLGTPEEVTSPRTSGFKRRPLSSMTLEGTAIEGKSGYVPTRRTEDMCRADCESNDQCVAYVVQQPGFGKPLTCTLLKTVGAQRSLDGFSAGYKGLTYF